MEKYLAPKKIYSLIIICFIFFFLLIQACSIGGRPRYEIENYILDYQSPTSEKQTQLDKTIRFDRFTITSAYNTQNMIFRTDNYSLDFFNYNRWAVNPTDMVADDLLRDMQASGFFHAVFSRYTVEEANFLLQGGIGEFFLRVEKNSKIAVISLEITLKNSNQVEANKRIIFQKKYHHEELLTEQTPRGYCQAMSQALKIISQEITVDVYQAIKESS
ncbi:MAG: ABC-type transport auxiliary lipoprotein family protein [Smithellaceae bacterium]